MFIDMFMQKLQLSSEYVTEYLQKHAQKIQLTKHQKSNDRTPPPKCKSFFKARATPPGPPFCPPFVPFVNTNLVIPQSEKILQILQTTWFCRNNMWYSTIGNIQWFYQEFRLTFLPSIYLVN